MRHACLVLAFVFGSALTPTCAADAPSDADLVRLIDLALRGAAYDHPKVRGAAFRALASLPRVPLEAQARLLRQLETPEARRSGLAAVAARALARLGPAVVPDIVALAGRGDADALQAFLGALDRAGPAGKEVLKALLKSDDATVRRSALAHAGILGEDAGPFIAEAVRTKDVHAFAQIVRGLGDGTPGRPAVPALREVVRSWQEEPSVHAARLLARIGPDAREALPDLRSAMTDASLAARQEFARAVWKIGGDAAPLVDVARAVLASGAGPGEAPPALRLEAARCLRELGAGARPALPDMLEALAGGPRTYTHMVRAEILRALPLLGPETMDHILRFVSDKRLEVRRAAVEALAEYTPADEVPVGTLAELLEDKDAVVRRFAARALSRHGRRALPAAERFAKMLDEVGSPGLAAAARAAEEALVAIGPGAKEHVLAAVTSGKRQYGASAARILASYGPSAVADIEKILSSKTAHRNQVGAAVTVMALVGAEAVPKAAEWARRKGERFRRAGLASLALIQPEGVEQLKVILKESEYSPRSLLGSAEEGMRRTGIPQEMKRELLAGLMKEDDRELRAFAARFLGGRVYRKGGREAMPLLVGMLSDRDPRCRTAGVERLSKLYDMRDEAAREIARMTTDIAPPVRKAAYRALRDLRGWDASRAALDALFRERDPELRKLVVWAFGGRPQAVPALLRVIEREKGPRAERAAEALRCCGPLAVLAFIDLFKDGDPEKKRMAGEALRALGDVAAPALFEMLE